MMTELASSWSSAGAPPDHSVAPEYDGSKPAGRKRHHGGSEPLQHAVIAGSSGDHLLET